MNTKLTKHPRMIAALVLTALVPLTSYGVITGSAHDFSAATWNSGSGSGQICKVCHTPHNAKVGAALQIIPLLNHETTATAAFTLYSTANSGTNTLNAVTGQPVGTSKACLSCHDGTVALSSMGSTTGGVDRISTANLLGTDLSNDHPISFTYDAALATADGSLVTPATASLAVTGVPLFGAKMECASCHDVHNTLGIANLLRVSTGNSALCLKCHSK